ncbi:MAG: hypothetical protein EKK64_04705 [Neisseriaceae bacterium]|nr:MAG: hypothetical protein EKK64_04705 [Neisseriaceae bacterium]
MKNSTKLLLASLVGVATLNLMSCSSSSGDSNGPKPVPPGPTPNGVTSLQIGQIGAIPTDSAVANASYPLVLLNNTKQAINGVAVKATGVDPRLNIASDSQLFDASQCKSIPAGGSCSIMVKANSLRVNNVGDNGQYGLQITGKSADGKTSYSEAQIVSYENFKAASKIGVNYNTSGAATTNITKPTQMMVTLPVYFDKAYSNVKIEAPGVSANLIGCGLISANGTYNISANSACSIVLDFRGGRPITSNVKLLADSVEVKKSPVDKSVKSTKSKSLTSGGNQILSLGFVNLPNSAALITTGFVTSSIPTDNTTLQTVTFVNNGMTGATQMNLTFADVANGYSPTNISATQTIGLNTVVTVTANTCTSQAGGSGNGSLAATSSCSVTFRIDGNTQYGNLRLAMDYNTGIGTANTGFNTYYYPPQSTATLSASASPSASYFLNTAVGSQVKAMTVTITNTGTSPVTLSTLSSDQNILKTAGQPGVPNGMNVTANTCVSGFTLNANSANSCAYTVTFDPTVVTSSQINNLYGVISGTYTSLGNTYVVSNSLNMPYSVNEATDLTFNPTELQLTTNVGQPVYIPLSITNTNELGSGTITNITFDWASIGASNVTTYSQSPSGCLSSLAYGSTCDVVFEYAPISAESNGGNYSNLPVIYTGGKFESDDIPTTYQAINGNTNVQITSVSTADLNNPPVISTGQGTSSQPYTFYNYGNSFGLTITYTNSGTVDADNFSIDGNTLPATSTGWLIDTANTTCAIGTQGTTLAASGSCNLALIGGNQNLQNVMTTANTMTFDFPVASYDESGQVLVRNVWDYNSQANVYVTQNPILVPSYSIGSGVLESVGGQSYYVYPVTLQNNANAGQTAPVTVTIDPTQYDLGSVTAGLGASNTTVPAGGAYSTTLAGGQQDTPLYLWIPYQSTLPTSNLYATWTYAPLVATQSFGNVQASSVAAGVFYTASGATITPRWSAVTSAPYSYAAPGAPTINTVNAPATILDMVQYQGYVYAMTGAGVYSYAITPWADNAGTMIPDSTTGTGTGALTVTSSGASQISGEISDTPGAFAINTVGGNTYALVTEAGAFTTAGGDWPYVIATIANGVFTNTAGTFTGLTDNQAIVSVAVSEAGNIYVVLDDNTAFSCQTTTQAAAGTAACTQLTLPTSITTAASNTTLASLSISAVGGEVSIVQVTADPSAAGNFLPTTKYLYATDQGSSTDFTAGTLQNPSGFIDANPYTYYYNLDATATTATPIYAMSGKRITTSGSPNYTHNTSAGAYSANLATPTYNGVGSSAFGIGMNAYYSFLTIDGQN